MNVGDYLFPQDLSMSSTGIRRVLIVGSCLVEHLVVYLKNSVPDVQFEFQIFNNVMELPPKSSAEISAFDFQFISLSLREVVTDHAIRIGFDASGQRARAVADGALVNLEAALTASLRHTVESGLLTFVANFSVPQVSVSSALNRYGTDQDFTALVKRLNERVGEIVRRHRNVYVADVDAIGNSLGKSSFQDDAISFSAHGAFWSARHLEFDTNPVHGAPPRLDVLPPLESLYEFRDQQFFHAIWRQMACLYRVVRQIDPVKLVVFDLDDTLWRGQIAEHYGDEGPWPPVHGWPVGIWDAVYQLRGRGILTAVCSKNDEGLVRERWSRASHWLTLDDFTFREINWRPKAENVAAIMRRASLTAKSVVFVDDNPVEREAVRSAFPDIRVIGSNPYLTRRILLWSSETQVPFLSDESVNRDSMVRAQQRREQERASVSRDEFLANLGCTVTVGVIESTEHVQFARSLELLNKTNQFNTTGKRHGFQEVAAFFAEGGRFYVFDVEDKFTRYGLVGVIRFKDACFLQFAMSCRVLGLDVESSVVAYVVLAEAEARGTRDFEAVIERTEANMVSRGVYEASGFKAERADVYGLRGGRPADLASHLSFSPPPARAVSPRSWKSWFAKA